MDKELCPQCGREIDAKNSARYCSIEKKFVCQSCENLCQNYSAKLLPNGTHCFVSYRTEENYYRLLASRILAPEYDVIEAMPKYEAEKNTSLLLKKFSEKTCLYQNIDPDDTEHRAKARVELAAIQQILRKRILDNSKLSTWGRKILTQNYLR